MQLVENSAAPIPVAAQIVNLQVQYGIAAATAGSQDVIRWVDATDDTSGPTAANWAAPSAADARRIKAVRVAVVARSTQQERNAANNQAVVVTPSPLQLWPPDTMTTGSSMILSADQQRYRYKVYQTIIPLRNVLWASI